VLERAVSAFLSMVEFDDPARVQRELELLLGAGLPDRSIPTPETWRPNAKILELSDGRLRGEIAAPVTGSFYADHFPRRPVYPATLLLDAQIGLAAELLRRRTSSAPRLERVRHVKVRAFTPPGGRLAVDVEQTAGSDDHAVLLLRATAGDERVSSAQLEFALDG
jgi:3-hydroxymyristoyl/3-hydroxydecanoyl-(acyl carrier protein) dehydratase